jgi:hypothetical protein
MIDFAEYFDYWRTRIEKDLNPFTDPGTGLTVTGDKRQITANWTARGRPMEAAFSLSLDGGVQATYRGQLYSYKAFLASTDLADLLGLAKMILQVQPRGLFVPTKARLADDPDMAGRSAVDVLQELLTTPSSDLTRIIMVTGEAGAGKTRVLQELVKEQAHLYQRGRTDRLYLYINAQGRALARFNEALATELQDLRAVLTYHSVSALVRVGVLVPIIDGFDELLGVGGYDDAFSSLTGFIEELNGQGQMVASARSTYYEQEFVARASSVSALGAQAWTQIPVEVMPWEEEELSEYVRLHSESQQLASDEVAELGLRVAAVFSGRNAALRQKPLFVARTVDILRKDPDFEGGDDLLKQLVSAYIERERKEKLLDRHGGNLLTTNQMELLFKTLAEEMWNQETRELDRRSVREVAEFVLVTEGLSDAVQRVVVERMPQLAFLIPGERSGGISFEHEMLFSYFLAQVFRETLFKDTAAVRVLLSRSVLPVEVALTAIEAIHLDRPLSSSENAQALLDRLAKAGQLDTPRTSQVRENAGVFVGALLKTGTASAAITGLRIWGVVLPGGDLHGVELRGTCFERVEFRRVDLSGTRFIACRADALTLSEVVVDPARTRLELIGLDVPSQVLGLRIREMGLVRGVYDPAEVRRILADCGALTPTSSGTQQTIRTIPAKHRQLLEKLARVYRRTNPVCTADDILSSLFDDPCWDEIERLLVRHGIITRETRSTSGRAKTFLRRQFLPEELMAGADRMSTVPAAVRAFWDDLERETANRIQRTN